MKNMYIGNREGRSSLFDVPENLQGKSFGSLSVDCVTCHLFERRVP